MIFVVDFGGQTAHLISRRIKELGVETLIINPDNALEKVKEKKPQGIIFSGGPASVYEKNAPTIDKEIFSWGIPILGICYGLQLSSHLLGGKVVSGKKEYGPASLEIGSRLNREEITKDLPKSFVVWMSHGDEVIKLPKGFEIIGSTEHVPFAFVQDPKRKIIGLQFHPEVEHTEYGSQILKNFIEICVSSFVILGTSGVRTPESSTAMRDSGRALLRQGSGSLARMTKTQGSLNVKNIIRDIKKTVQDAYVIGAVSGGVDSTVAGTLTAKAIGKRFIPVFVDNGLMREGTKEYVKKIFEKISTKPIVVNAAGEMLRRLKGIIDSEEKRKIIGNFYIEIFEREMKKLIRQPAEKKIPVKFLLQGTIYSDVIESQGTKHAAKIKSHHNVGGLPKDMKLKLLEPLRHFYKDEVRQIGKMLGLSDEFVWKQVFPGPGYAVRIRGEVTQERLEKIKQADKIVMEELEKANLLKDIYMSFPVLTGADSVAVKGDGRFFGEVVALRVLQSQDVMTANWMHLPYEILQKISSRIVNEVPNVSRVVYDITTKPPATMEWE